MEHKIISFVLVESQKAKKGEALEDVYSIISENFSVSRGKFLEFIQMILWFVLLAGWFVLLAFDITASLK